MGVMAIITWELLRVAFVFKAVYCTFDKTQKNVISIGILSFYSYGEYGGGHEGANGSPLEVLSQSTEVEWNSLFGESSFNCMSTISSCLTKSSLWFSNGVTLASIFWSIWSLSSFICWIFWKKGFVSEVVQITLLKIG